MSKTTQFDSRIKKYAYREVTQLYGELGSSPAGLSPEQVERQREKYGSSPGTRPIPGGIRIFPARPSVVEEELHPSQTISFPKAK